MQEAKRLAEFPDLRITLRSLTYNPTPFAEPMLLPNTALPLPTLQEIAVE
jgi:hypothetical protein